VPDSALSCMRWMGSLLPDSPMNTSHTGELFPLFTTGFEVRIVTVNEESAGLREAALRMSETVLRLNMGISALSSPFKQQGNGKAYLMKSLSQLLCRSTPRSMRLAWVSGAKAGRGGRGLGVLS